MSLQYAIRFFTIVSLLLLNSIFGIAQKSVFKLKYKNSSVYAGIEVGSKGVKMSVLEIGNNAKKNGTFNVLKDTSLNSDFISFSPASFQATVDALTSLYTAATKEYFISPESIFTVVSSGVKIMADKENKDAWINKLVDSFKAKVHDPNREVPVIDIVEEAKLSHLGIVPESRRYSTFLIDIGSGNTKGGFFPNGDTKTLKLFQLTWGTKSVANATEKRCDDDKTLENYNKQLNRVLTAAENAEIIYMVNESGAYPMSDYIAFSGGIAWSVANMMYPELIGNSVVPVTYDDVLKFKERIFRNYASLNELAVVKSIKDNSIDKVAVAKEIKMINRVFDQRSLLAGTGLLLKIMRQFEGVNEKKQFFLVKNGQVGWISAYVDKQVKQQQKQ
jgi:exopolyphosphatase/pppGpp-phosphohydrolase